MIQINSDVYTADLHMSEAEAGILMETALDLMESRGQTGSQEEPRKISTEILAEEIPVWGPYEIRLASSCFTGGEWMFIGRTVYLLNEVPEFKGLRVMAYTRPDGERGLDMRLNNRRASVVLPPDCGEHYILKGITLTLFTMNLSGQDTEPEE